MASVAAELIREVPDDSVKAPSCPYCRSTPFPIRIVTEKVNDMVLATICCGMPMCRKVFNVQILTIENPTSLIRPM